MILFQRNLFFFLFLISAVYVKGQHLLSTNGKAIVNENMDTILLRGMGLGGWMLQEGYMLQTASFANAQYQIRNKIEQLIGEEDTNLFYDAWLANHCRKADIDSLKAWGFNSVRLPMHYKLFTLPIEDEPILNEQTWLDKGFELTDSLISWCKQNEMYVILDLHGAPGGQGMDQGISDYDPSKPSLWESGQNTNKTVVLWKRIAERYVDEDWVAGYDLLNEPNWDLPGGIFLRNLYVEITQAIREVDTRHIIFIEGNWFANDFTGLTPPWDDNMVYSPHKYWSYNDQASIQWVLDMREDFNVPLYLGESGENSNVWFRDAIRLFEDHDIGWAWWPMKKIENIAGPLSVPKTSGYQTLLNYWGNNGAKPTAEFAKNALLEMTENLKIENCIYQKDVIDAMFRQVYSNETKPFSKQIIPCVVFASDYDLGVHGEAYADSDVANYRVSTGTFTTWNNGWFYRNDGVDLEPCSDPVSNGVQIGFVKADEWTQYEIEVEEDGVYDINTRIASGSTGGHFHFEMDGAAITIPYYVPNTGGWDSWRSLTFPDVVLSTDDRKLKMYVDGEGFNISSFEFVRKGPSTEVETKFVAAVTTNPNRIQISCNKFIEDSLSSSASDFEIRVNGNPISIQQVSVDATNSRILYFDLDYTLRFDEEITISYNGNQVQATDASYLTAFSLQDVKNILSFTHQIPGKIEAEDFFFQAGIQLEDCTDTGGGQNIAHLDPNDYIDYKIDIANAGNYRVEYRTASLNAIGEIELQLRDTDGNILASHSPSFNPTGGWQSWATYQLDLDLPAGLYDLRILVKQAPFNLNWMEFSNLTKVEEIEFVEKLICFPNPTSDLVHVNAQLKKPESVNMTITNSLGEILFVKKLIGQVTIDERISLSHLNDGIYFLTLLTESGMKSSTKIFRF